MPKIVIREFDNTTAAGAAYANFAVVVPGFYSADKDADETAAKEAKTGKYAFDENGVFECRTRKEFKDKIGLTSSIKHLVAAAKAPTYAKDWEAPAGLTEALFNELVKEGNLYRAEADPSSEVGEYQDNSYKYQKATEDEEEKSSYVFLPEEDNGGEEESTEGAEATSTELPTSPTLFVQLAYVGQDAIEENHMGNQIAWELLGLGYTVLYKKLNSITYLEDEEFWEPLKDKTLYDFRYIMSGLLAGNQAIYQNMVNIAKFEPENRPFDEVEPATNGRGDCIALLDIDEDTYKGQSQLEATKKVLAFAKDKVPATKYAAAFVPAVTYSVVDKDDVFGNKTFPASFHYLACAARSSEKFSEWYANAGYTRGISKYTIDGVGCKFGEAAVNMFQKRAKDSAGNTIMAINPIIQLRGSYYLWGNRTTEALGAVGTPDGDLKASHFLNIRQLCCTLKKQVYVACRQFTFDPNSDALWINFCNSIKPILEKMKADQGIADYKIIKVKNARKAFLSAIVRIVPIEAVEDFDISIYLEDSLGGMIATAEE